MASSPDKNASISPRPGSLPSTEVAPQLESVLRNLNVNLEDELARYRRQRHGRVPPSPPPRRATRRQSIDLISVPAVPSSVPAPLPSPPSDNISEAPGPEAPRALSAPPPAPPNPFLNKAAEAAESEEEFDLPELDPISELAELGLDETEDVKSPEEDPVSDELSESVLPVHSGETHADGYLESSEELLKSIEADQVEPSSVPEPYSPQRKNNGLLKLAGLVLVLLGGIGFGFAVTSPSQLQNLRALLPTGEPEQPNETVVEDPGASTNEAQPEESSPAAAPTTVVEDTVSEDYKPPGPDLSTREFKELDDVNDLVTLDVDGTSGVNTPTAPTPSPETAQSSPVQTPLPETAQTPLSNPAQTPLPSPTQSPAPAPASDQSATAEPATAAAPPAVSAAPAPDAAVGSNFYIIANYTGDESLNKAREFVPDAFVRNFKAGTRIQLAAFDNRSQAESQAAFLNQLGIAVELFGPTNE